MRGKRDWRMGWRLWVMAVLTVMVLTACSGNDGPDSESITPPDQGVVEQGNGQEQREDDVSVTTRPKAVVEQLDEEERTKFPGIHIETMVVQNKQYYYAAHFPMTEYESANEVIRATIDQRIDDFEENVVALKRDSEKSWPFEMNISFELYYADTQFLSVLMRDTRFMGGAHLEEEQYVLNLRLPDGEPLQASDIFKDSSYLEQLSKRTHTYLRDKAKLEDGELLQAGTAPNPDNFNLLTFDKTNVTVHFTNYQVAPGSEGTFSVAVPYRQLASSLDPSFVDELDLQASLAATPSDSESPDETQTEQPKDEDGASNPDSEVIEEEGNEAVDPSTDSNDQTEEKEPVVEDTETGAKPETNGEQSESTPGQPAVVKDKRVALTFDDGPHGEYTGQILDQLADHGAKATFFILGNRLAFYPDVAKRIVNEGHELGNHTWDHSRLTRLSAEEITQQIKKTNEAAQEYAGQQPKFMRPPYGAYNDLVQQTADIPLVLWSVDTLDWKERNTDIIVQNVLNDVHDGAVILFHDLYDTTADAIGQVLVKLGEQGYEFVTVSELFQFDQMENGGVGEVFRRYKR